MENELFWIHDEKAEEKEEENGYCGIKQKADFPYKIYLLCKIDSWPGSLF